MSLRASAATLVLLIAPGCGGPRAGQIDGSAQPPAAEPQVCTRDAKVCPDGSTVGRTGPNCEFAPCPAAPEAPAE